MRIHVRCLTEVLLDIGTVRRTQSDRRAAVAQRGRAGQGAALPRPHLPRRLLRRRQDRRGAGPPAAAAADAARRCCRRRRRRRSCVLYWPRDEGVFDGFDEKMYVLLTFAIAPCPYLVDAQVSFRWFETITVVLFASDTIRFFTRNWMSLDGLGCRRCYRSTAPRSRPSTAAPWARRCSRRCSRARPSTGYLVFT